MSYSGVYNLNEVDPNLNRIGTYPILKISNIKNLILGDILYIKNKLEKYGNIISFRTVNSIHHDVMWLIEFDAEYAVKNFIDGELNNLLIKYPYLQIGYYY